jgi:hypothetical protein
MPAEVSVLKALVFALPPEQLASEKFRKLRREVSKHRIVGVEHAERHIESAMLNIDVDCTDAVLFVEDSEVRPSVIAKVAHMAPISKGWRIVSMSRYEISVIPRHCPPR